MKELDEHDLVRTGPVVARLKAQRTPPRRTLFNYVGQAEREATLNKYCERAVLRLAFLLLLVPTALTGQVISATPGKVTKQYKEGDVSFKYPEHWDIVDHKGSEVMIGSTSRDSIYRYNTGDFVTLPTHGMLFGSYDGNATNLEDAAYELLGVLRQRLPYLVYRDDAKKTGKVGNRDFFYIGITHDTHTTGVLLITSFKKLTWYWLFFHPLSDAREYLPTTEAIMRSITIPLPDEGFGPSTEEGARKAEQHPTVSRSTDLSSQEVAKRCFPSVVTLVTRDAKGHLLALGSGFVVHIDVIATNLHVWTGANHGIARFIGSDVEYLVGEILAKDMEHDLVLLRIEANGAPPLPLGNSASLTIGEKVYAVGNPEGLEGTFSDGIVSSVRNVGDAGTLLQITAPISAGSSGGPVLNARGEVIGISTATLKNGQNLNFAIPSDYLQALLRKAGIGAD